MSFNRYAANPLLQRAGAERSDTATGIERSPSHFPALTILWNHHHIAPVFIER